MKELKLVPLFVFIVIPISGVVSQLQCPFPGIPANSVALSDEQEEITWENRRPFSPREHVTFRCKQNGPDDKVYEIICRDDGTWNKLPPYCGNRGNLHKLEICLTVF
jgi:hypothetical protein